MRVLRFSISAMFILSAICICRGIYLDNRFAWPIERQSLRVIVVLFITAGTCISILSSLLRTKPLLSSTAVGLGIILSLRFWMPLLLNENSEGNFLNEGESEMQKHLRLLQSAQEQYRIASGRYSSSVSELRFNPQPGFSGTLVLSANGDSSWKAKIIQGASVCQIYGGFASEALMPEGVPWCGSGIGRRHTNQMVHIVPFRVQSTFQAPVDLDSGHWNQQGADAKRSAAVPGRHNGIRWTAFLNGEARAGASIVKGRVLVGAHGNGEVAAYRASDGVLLWRNRAPNWLHHEPVGKGQIVVYGFGNNELYGAAPRKFGSPPSGFEAINISNGKLVWRNLTASPAMSAPAIWRNAVIGREASGSVHSWDLATGRQLWSVNLPGMPGGPMTNPAVEDSLVVVTAEPANWCSIQARTGRIVRCGAVADEGWGGGHSSPALSGRSLLFTHGYAKGRWEWTGRLFGPKFGITSVSLVSVDVISGEVNWKVTFSGFRQPVFGHTAGTPLIVGDYTFVDLPTIGEVVSVRISDGQIAWRRRVMPSRGSVSEYSGRIFVAQSSGSWVVLDARNGAQLCSAPLPDKTDRAGISIVGGNGVMTFNSGRIEFAPMFEWTSCNVRFM